MRQVTVAEWAYGLRSGFYTQFKGALRGPTGFFCALGVACDLAGATTENNISDQFNFKPGASLASNDWIGEIMRMNDSYGKTFSQIADWIEEKIEDTTPKGLWTEPANHEDGARIVEEALIESPV